MSPGRAGAGGVARSTVAEGALGRVGGHRVPAGRVRRYPLAGQRGGRGNLQALLMGPGRYKPAMRDARNARINFSNSYETKTKLRFLWVFR